MTKTLILCDCLGSQTLDANAIEAGSGLRCSKIHTALCTDQIEDAAAAIAKGDAIIACQQERARFEALAEEIEVDPPAFVDLRDRAGWSADAETAPKMAALAAEAVLPLPLAKSIDIVSEGTCLIIGTATSAVPAAERLAETLAVTLLLTDGSEPPIDHRFDTIHGQVRKAAGALGHFTLTIDGLRQVIPGGRGAPEMTEPRDGAASVCDIILDLSGGTPLFPAPEKREGYLRADPGSQPAVAKAVFDAAQLIGTFEKPLYVRTEPALCAHSRAGQPACSKCLNICPTSAITSEGDHVAIDPLICAGCGACSAVCPSGAIAYDAPPVDSVFQRLQTLASTYRKAGGTAPRLLAHDADHGTELISLSARFDQGLPADVIPLEVDALSGFGHAEMLGALACGFADVTILLAPKTDRDAVTGEMQIAQAVAGDAEITLLDISDPSALSDALYTDKGPSVRTDPILPIGTRRQITRTAAKTLTTTEIIPLPAHAPYGAVLVDTDACTLCLSCVSLCPSGALGDNPDAPQLRFQEDACLQCGLCANICPETAITLEPRLNQTDAALAQVVLHEEEPFACIECGALFGVKSTVEKITEKLAGKHAMFGNPEAAKMIQMCDTCRINAQYHSKDNPFAGGERPKPRTTADYFSKRKDH
ncbi:4Fe-4S binding protein [Litoreibacter roseus]|uniref:4Fe-4S ferredoxin n=1 Tax=Litoreibacter roseus TaxID=2601869 RepID=A0A6N6J9Z7_9RHOB|nr:4Fe-4S binding protein [Litoreibacter roseus]GFE63015.1 4Fe-4S ferredoxin [Litoreibacter roseus]